MGSYRYGAECQQGAGPHALCETSDGQRYWYDANGSMVGDSSGRRIEYSSFDKPVKIATADHTTRFAYNPNRARYLRTDENAQGVTTLTRYLGNVERITRPDGRQEIKRRLPGGALISFDPRGQRSNLPALRCGRRWREALGKKNQLQRVSCGIQ